MGLQIILIAIVYFLVFSAATICIGAEFLKRSGFMPGSIPSLRGRVGLSLVLGLGLWGILFLVLSGFRGAWSGFGQVFFIALTVLIIAKWHVHIEDLIEEFKKWKSTRRESGRGMTFHGSLTILLVILFLLAFVNSCAPPSGWDELVDHLPRASFIMENGAFAMNPSTPFGGYPALCELIFAPMMNIADELPAVVVFIFAVSLFLMIAGFARTFLPPGWANASVLIFFTMPLVSDLMRTALVDIPLAAFCFAAFYMISLCVTNFRDDVRSQYRSIFTAGLFLGFALSVKYNGLLVAAGWVIVLPALLCLTGHSHKRVAGLCLTLIVTAIGVSMTWYVRNLLLFGNPFDPFFAGLFSGGAERLSVEAFSRPEMGKSWAGLLMYPVSLTYDLDLIRHWYRAIAPAFLCFIPLALIFRIRGKIAPIFFSALGLGIIHLFLAYYVSPGHTRYLLPLWAVWAPMAAYGMWKVSDNSKLIGRILIPLILIGPMILSLAVQGKRTVELGPYITGKMKRGEMIREEMPSFKLMKRIPKLIKEDSKILSIEPRIYYMPEGTVIGTPGIEAPGSVLWSEEKTAALVRYLEFSGFTHLYVDFSSRQIRHAIGMDFFIAAAQGKEGRYYSHDGIVEEMRERYGIEQYFSREDLYLLSAIGGFDIYQDASGLDWHWVDVATIEERAKHSANLSFIRHFWLLEKYMFREISREGSAVLYEINYRGLSRLRGGMQNYKGGRLLDYNRKPSLTPELQYPNEDELTLLTKQDGTGMI